MKKVIKPPTQEECVYYTDFLGKPCNPYPSVVLKLLFNYGSRFDGEGLELHLSDDEVYPILKQIAQNLSNNTKKQLKFELHDKHLFDVLSCNE